MKMKNKKTGNIVDVSPEHARNVLIPQGKYEVYEEPVVEPVKKVSKKPSKKRIFRTDK